MDEEIVITRNGRPARIGRLRLVYRVPRAEIQVVAIGPRTSIYEETSRLVRRGPGPKKRT